MKKEEFEAKIAELQAKIAELKKTLIKDEKPTPPHPRWLPKESEIYYYISDTSGIHIDRWNSDNIDEFRFITGNVFRRDNVFQISAEAEFALERLKVLAEMREWAGNIYDRGFIFYYRPADEIRSGWTDNRTHCFADIHFKCSDDAENCIKAVGKERLKKYYFMIPEGDQNNG